MTDPTLSLPEVDTCSLAQSGCDIEYISGYERGFEAAVEKTRAYATAAVLAERERCAKLVAAARMFDLIPELAEDKVYAEALAEMSNAMIFLPLADAIRKATVHGQS